MPLIPDEIIAQVIDRCDIVEMIVSYIPLKRAGQSFKANCPFHQEKTPSFIVNPHKQIFHCFGCGAGGNVVSFVMKQERMEFPEAIRFLAQKVNVPIPADEPSQPHAANIRQTILKVNALAVNYFHQMLLADQTPAAQGARAYLQQRKVSLDTVHKFQLGFASDRWDGLLTHLRKEGISLGLMEKAGLIIPRERGDGYYDRFRNRIIFPIFDTQAHCRAFGARALDSQTTAKYINSPETILYTKGHHLYGFHLAKQSVGEKDSVVIVEGYMDCLMPYQAGITNVVASLGTALTVEQIRLLRRYTRNVVMLFDADPAGESAMMRSLDMLIEEGIEVKVATLEEGEDPDSFVRRYGAEDLRGRIANARGLFDYKLNVLMGRLGARSVEAKAKIASEMLPTIHRFSNELIRAEYIKRLAKSLDVDEELLAREYKKAGQALSQRISAKMTEHTAVNQARARAVERSLLRLMMEKEEFISQAKDEVILSDFQDARIRSAISKIFELFDQGRRIDPSSLINSLEDPGTQQMLSGLLSEEEVGGDREKMYRDCIARMRHDKLKFKRQQILQCIQQAESGGDSARVSELTRQFNQSIKSED